MQQDAIKVLIVDDLEVNRFFLVNGLKRRGYDTYEATNGTEALGALNERTFDIVLLDIVMPGMSGKDALRLIRARYTETELPVIMVTTLADPESVSTALIEGASDYLNKPLNLDVTIARINVLVARRRAVLELQETNNTIRQQVDQRTRDLERINDELRVEIKRRRTLETELREARRKAENANRAKSDFLATMSHELRTPLNSIIGFSDLIGLQSRTTAEGERLSEYASYINESGNHLLGIVNDILDLSKIDAGRTVLNESHVDVEDLMSRSIRMVDSGDGDNRIIHTLAPDLVGIELFCDEVLMRRALVNLISNAVKFSEPTSPIQVTAACTDDGALTLSVADQGIGIAPEDMDKVMEPFGQANSKLSRSHVGTGLGVPLTRSLAELHGGDFELTSEPGVGTTVTLALPADRLKRRQTDAAQITAA